MSDRAAAALQAILEEVVGASQPFSDDSSLPAHLIHDARMALQESAGDESPDAEQWRAYEQILLNRLRQADEIIKFLRHKNSELAKRVQFYEKRTAE